MTKQVEQQNRTRSSTTLMKTMAMDIALVSPKMVAASGKTVAVLLLLKKFMFLDKKKRNKKKVSIECSAILLYSTHLSFIFFGDSKKEQFYNFAFWKKWYSDNETSLIHHVYYYALRWRCPETFYYFFFIFFFVFFWGCFFCVVLFWSSRVIDLALLINPC